MATFESTRPAPFGAVTIFRVFSAIDSMRETLVEWNNNRVTRNVLSRLSDHELEDIGLTRGDIARF